MIRSEHLEVVKTGRYFVAGSATEPDEVVIVLHGYGMLPEYFLRKFEPLVHASRIFIAPEALSRFYVQGSSGRVGASWMTKEDRLMDISDNNRYLQQIVELPAVRRAKRLILLGFSQGAATAARFYCTTSHRFDAFIVWAGVFPPDVDLEVGAHRLKETNLHLVLGTNDEYMQVDQLRMAGEVFAAHGVQAEQHFFDGKHEIHLPLLAEILG